MCLTCNEYNVKRCHELNMKQHVYIHVDCDCFYAQCEELRDENLSKVPLGITQKYLIVTCNYKARARGVTKLMSILDAQAKCPEIVLVDGSDLTPYKAISDRIMDILHVYGNVKRLGCDEMFLDVTEEVSRRLMCEASDAYVGHLWVPGSSVRQDSIHRVMDLRAMDDESHGRCHEMGKELIEKATTKKLFVGSHVARDIRRVVMSATKIRVSAGIATSQIMAKLISGLHKPNDQTILLPEFAKDFLADLPVRAIPGVGAVLQSTLAAHDVVKVSDLWSWSHERLRDTFGEKQGSFLYYASQGMDHADSLITASAGGFTEPKTISLEDSMRTCSGFLESKSLLQKLAPDLVYRIHTHFQKFGKCPTTLTVTYRMKEAGMHERHACSIAMPGRIDASSIVESALVALKKKLREPFHLNLLNIAAKNFQHAAEDSIHLDMSHDGPIKSKREIRIARESETRCDAPHDNDDASFWRDLNDVDGNNLAKSTKIKKRAPSRHVTSNQRKKITSFFQKK